MNKEVLNMAEKKRFPKIVTFRKKDQRQEQKLDKQEILGKHVKTRMNFFDVLALQEMAAVPLAFDGTLIGHDVNLFDLPIISGSFTDAETKAIQGDPNVEMIEDDLIAHAMPTAQAITEPFSPAQPPQLNIEDVPTLMPEILPWGVNKIDAERAWNVTRGAGIRVAVIDTGIDSKHQDLSANFAGGVSFVPGESYMDVNGHGTHVAGTIGASHNGSGVVGVAPNCNLYAVKALNRYGQGNYSWIISAIIWCVRQRIDVINMSLGGPDPVQALQNACDFAYKNNVFIVAAAGNSGPSDDTVNYPARYDSVISVSSIDASGNIANTSSRGQQVDLAAPGVNILSTLPGNRYGHKNGTSMAAPHVTGAAALAISSHRFTRAETIRTILLQTADNLGIPGRDNEYGHGLVDAEQSAFIRHLQ
jgi:subtilisin